MERISTDLYDALDAQKANDPNLSKVSGNQHYTMPSPVVITHTHTHTHTHKSQRHSMHTLGWGFHSPPL